MNSTMGRKLRMSPRHLCSTSIVNVSKVIIWLLVITTSLYLAQHHHGSNRVCNGRQVPLQHQALLIESIGNQICCTRVKCLYNLHFHILYLAVSL